MREKTKLNPEKGHPAMTIRFRDHSIEIGLDLVFTKIMNIQVWLKTIVSVTLSKYKTHSGLQNLTFGLFVILSH